jgi:hypothetical protein
MEKVVDGIKSLLSFIFFIEVHVLLILDKMIFTRSCSQLSAFTQDGKAILISLIGNSYNSISRIWLISSKSKSKQFTNATG